MCQRASKTATAIEDGKSGSEYPRVFAGTDADNNVYIGVSKNGASHQNDVQIVELNTTYLLVLSYEVIDGTNNDVVTLWINPVQDGTSYLAKLSADASKADASTSMGMQGVTLRQASTSSSKIGPDVLVDAIRIGTAWEDLWPTSQGGDDPTPDPTPTVKIIAPTSVSFGDVLQFSSVTQTITVKGENLTSDVTVTCSASEVTPSVEVIPVADVLSETGYELTLTYSAQTTTLSGSITLSSEGADDVVIPLSASVTPVTAFANFKQIPNMTTGDLGYFSGKATVTFVDSSTGYIYAQDLYGGGVLLNPVMLDTAPLKKGDRFTKFYCMPDESSMGIIPVYLLSVPEITATDVEVTPAEVTFSELARDPETYLNRLVTISDVDFGEAAGGTFSTSSVSATSNDATGLVRTFSSTDLVGYTIPARATSIIGISTSASAAVVTMRSQADLAAAEEVATFDATIEYLIDVNEYQAINTSVQYGKITVTYANRTTATPVYITGANKEMFAIDTEEIPAGSGTAEVLITYTPTAAGVHSATISFDTADENFKSFSLTAKAYDPAAVPTITVDTSTLTEFEAAVGESQQQTITYTTANLPDYGSIALSNPGTFIISSASMLKDETGTLTITFSPKSEGTFSETITFSADQVTPVVITVTGHTISGGGGDTGKEGDEFTDAAFDTANAYSLVIEDFETLNAAANKPFHLDAWTNVALTGNRAWWSYEESDGNHAAKVTAYDFFATESTDAQMLLISPCLDFVNAAEPLLTFRVKGLIMTDGMTDNLQVIYIDPTTGEQGTLSAQPTSVEGSPLANVWYEDLGFDIPASSEYNDTWVDFVVDLKGQNIADKFFIGFAYTATRGKDSSTSYLVDDFSWGRNDIAFIRPSVQSISLRGATDVEIVSETISVEGLNLTGDISIAVTGEKSSKFTVEPATLPASGGEFVVKFLDSEDAEFTSYVSLTADGAPESLIELNISNKTDAISDVLDVTESEVRYFNLQGVEVHNPTGGIYIRVKGTEATKVFIK